MFSKILLVMRIIANFNSQVLLELRIKEILKWITLRCSIKTSLKLVLLSIWVIFQKSKFSIQSLKVRNIINLCFVDLSAGIGGVIYSNGNCNITIESSTFTNIYAIQAGVMLISEQSSLDIAESIFKNNVA